MIEVKSAKIVGLNEAQLKRLYEIVRVAYELTEVEVWGPHYVRISYDEYLKLIEKDEILVAFFQDEVVGGIHCYRRNSESFAFSLLAADFDKSGLGIGQALIDAVIEKAKLNGAQSIQIEILRPKGMEVPFKVRLDNWYKKMGFVYTHSQNFAEAIPIKAKNLIRPCDFDYYWLEI